MKGNKMQYKNNNKVWSDDEDRFLKQQIDLGMSSRKIFENYGKLLGRTERAIQNRVVYLNKPLEERMKDDANAIDQSELLELLNEISSRICNRLDTLTRQNERLLKALDEMHERNEKQCDAYLKALYEIKTSASENAGDTKVIKNEVKRITHKMKV